MNYERRRSKNRGPNEKWISNKYDLQGHWQEVQQTLTSIKGKDGRFLDIGEVMSALKRSWKAYKIAGRNGSYRTDIAYRINNLEDGLGIEKAIFPELDEMDVYDEDQNQESREEIFDDPDMTREEQLQIRKEERQDQLEREQKVLGIEDQEDADDWWGSEDRQVRGEERQERQNFIQEMVEDIRGDGDNDDW